ncbi:MAG: hypothetical protein BGP03_17385 [Pseudonocardia sp. 73-21]|nr:MAG: hypothetical protein BGP03_17385 [Pseudonocardia sp. 73-21]
MAGPHRDRPAEHARRDRSCAPLLEGSSRAGLTSAIRAAARGETVLTPSVAARLVGRMRGPRPESLSPREIEVPALVAVRRTHADVGLTCTSPRPR